MWTRHHKNRNTGRLILPTVCAAFLAYFGYHTYNGEYGINSKHQLEQRRTELTARLEKLHDERIHIERRANLLRDGNLEKDMLDEYARRALSMSKPDEVVIMLDEAFVN
ncbi:FtsB family cell division protein [Arvimicrobium flavum]|uniref:FtsB family cell division protein n=1 Tax=Arvimicrobium flavum TaxID=3393320 RepID=UPI00237A8F77|nr:septum formation initiator family protein [Mesorhizobium shangrilense]